MKKIVVGMSGGVDSSVAAALLKNEYEITGVTLRMQGDCFASEEEAIRDAAEVAGRLGIRHEVLDCRDLFDSAVKKYFAESYLQGRTPNPCLICNPMVKWKTLLDYADSIGAEGIATGHYAFVEQMPSGRYTLRMADSAKDQTYALYRLSQEQLARTRMPLGAYSKEEVRRMAVEIGLQVAEKPDSMEVCFIPDNNHAGFVAKYTGIEAPAGNFVGADGTVLGQHQGITRYTIGQRKGLGIAFGKPMFVTELRPETAEVVLGENEHLFRQELTAADLCYMGADRFLDGKRDPVPGNPEKRIIGRIRYSHKGAMCSIISESADSVRVRFDEPVRAITPGQSVVFYDEEGRVLGGGIITGN